MKAFNEPIKKVVPSTEELKSVQDIQFDILKTFKDFCDKFSINYFLAGDTLKGAVENKDFLPNTSGIEVLMARPDYDKFISTLGKNPIDGMKLHNFVTDSEYNLPFAKFAKIDDGQKDSYISVFVLDGMPNKLLSQKIRLFKYNLMFNKLNLTEIKANEPDAPFLRKMSLFFIGLCFWLKKGEKLKRKIETEIKRCSYKYSDKVVNLYGAEYYNILPKTAYVSNSQVKIITFRGVKFTMPYDMDAYFQSFIPPVKEEKVKKEKIEDSEILLDEKIGDFELEIEEETENTEE